MRAECALARIDTTSSWILKLPALSLSLSSGGPKPFSFLPPLFLLLSSLIGGATKLYLQGAGSKQRPTY